MNKSGATVARLPAPSLDGDAILRAAFALLDRRGLDQLTIRRLAEELATDPPAIRRIFSRRRDLLTAMARHILQHKEGIAPAGSRWQEVLRQRAIVARRQMMHHRDGALLIAQVGGAAQMPGEDITCLLALTSGGLAEKAAPDALRLIDRLTLGWTIAEQAGPLERDADASFAYQVEIILRGMTTNTANSGARVFSGENTQLFQSRLFLLLRMARDSAEIVYARMIDLSELDRRVLLLLKSYGDLNVAGISASMGADKGQVSRAVTRIEDMGLIERTGTRSPLRLSKEGIQLTDKLMRLADLRNRELTLGIDDQQLVDFFAVIEALMARAVTLYEQERKLAVAGKQQDGPREYTDYAGDDPNHGTIVLDRSRILPPLLTLSSYILRSGALAFKRRTGLSNFETWVLSEIAIHTPMSWASLIQTLNRDQSQAGRTINQLLGLGLIERHGAPGRRNGSFSPTAEGKRIHAVITEVGRQRSHFLLQNIPEPQLHAFLTTFDIIVANAESQLKREREVEGMAPSPLRGSP